MRSDFCLALVVLFFAVVAHGDAGYQPMIDLMTTPTSGQGTYYGRSTGGHCTLDPKPPLYNTNAFFSNAAMVSALYDNSNVCGACIQVTSTGTGAGANPIPSSFLVYVNDECPSCDTGGLDFGLVEDGAWGMTWEIVECPNPGNNMVQMELQGSNAYYIKLQIRNTIVPTYKVYVNDPQNGAVPLVKVSDNFFQEDPNHPLSKPFQTPMSLTMVSILGDSITDYLPSITNDQVFTGTTQYPAHGPSTAAPVTPSPPTPSTPAPSTSSPSTHAPSTSSPSTPAPVTSAPATPAPTADDIIVTLNPNVNSWWIAVDVSGGSDATSKVEIQVDGQWQEMTLEWWGEYSYSPESEFVVPLSLRLTSSADQSLVLKGIITNLISSAVFDTNADYPTAGSDATPPCGNEYTVVGGDTCDGIADDSNTTIAVLEALNPGIQCEDLQIGQQVCVSGSEVVAPPTTGSAPIANQVILNVVSISVSQTMQGNISQFDAIKYAAAVSVQMHVGPNDTVSHASSAKRVADIFFVNTTVNLKITTVKNDPLSVVNTTALIEQLATAVTSNNVVQVVAKAGISITYTGRPTSQVVQSQANANQPDSVKDNSSDAVSLGARAIVLVGLAAFSLLL